MGVFEVSGHNVGANRGESDEGLESQGQIHSSFSETSKYASINLINLRYKKAANK